MLGRGRLISRLDMRSFFPVLHSLIVDDLLYTRRESARDSSGPESQVPLSGPESLQPDRRLKRDDA